MGNFTTATLKDILGWLKEDTFNGLTLNSSSEESSEVPVVYEADALNAIHEVVEVLEPILKEYYEILEDEFKICYCSDKGSLCESCKYKTRLHILKDQLNDFEINV